MNKGTYFISGIDTDAGKSYVTGIIAKRLMEEGKSVITHKFIQTGCDDFKAFRSIDIAIHRKIMGNGYYDEDIDGTTSPCTFAYPASPHLASEMENRVIDFPAIEKSLNLLKNKFDIVLTEGAGGLVVPLTKTYNTLDYICDHKLPLIFVTSGRLGSINHTILSLEVAKSRGVDVVAVAYNHHFDNDGIISKSTFEYIKEYIQTNFPSCEIIDIETIKEVEI
ncbi:MAG: ATP-dependent dethiobiotin synthetase BioD [Bacteroidetes bacterium]|nr:ATP-dependent dethiobiotin synthetase BioD [Bacteroidota bacterium]